MTTNIYDIANQLERAIRNLPEYKAVEAVKVSVEANAEAKSTLDAYISLKGIQEKLPNKVKFQLKLTKRKWLISIKGSSQSIVDRVFYRSNNN